MRPQLHAALTELKGRQAASRSAKHVFVMSAPSAAAARHAHGAAAAGASGGTTRQNTLWIGGIPPSVQSAHVLKPFLDDHVVGVAKITFRAPCARMLCAQVWWRGWRAGRGEGRCCPSCYLAKQSSRG